ncbi:MAG: hypothetical protein KF812_01335 [Fimbriimonadaceae bacterium]|nr:hypothetical protein [Fimbriimonadaceae bacterium]
MVRESSNRVEGRAQLRERRPYLAPVKVDAINERSLMLFRRLITRLLPETFLPACSTFVGITFLFLVVVPRLFVTSNVSDLRVQAVEVSVALAAGVLIAAPLMLAGLAGATFFAVRHVAGVILGETVHASTKVTLPQFVFAYLRPLAVAMLPPFAAVAAFFGANAFTGKDDPLSSTLFFLAMIVGSFLSFWGLISLGQLFGSRLVMAPVMLLEGKGFREATDRCKFLMKDRLAHQVPVANVVSLIVTSGLVALLLSGSLGTVLSMMFEITLPPALFNGPLGDLFSRFLTVLPSLFCFWAVMPLWGVIGTVIYFDRVCRLEAYDIRIMAEELREGGHRTRLLR